MNGFSSDSTGLFPEVPPLADDDMDPVVYRFPSVVVEVLSPELPSSVDADVDAMSSLVDKSPLVDDINVLFFKFCFSSSMKF